MRILALLAVVLMLLLPLQACVVTHRNPNPTWHPHWHPNPRPNPHHNPRHNPRPRPHPHGDVGIVSVPLTDG